jgi:hypothetical protein
MTTGALLSSASTPAATAPFADLYGGKIVAALDCQHPRALTCEICSPMKE